jgi:hypothetical protein
VSNGFEKTYGRKPQVYGFRVEVEANSLDEVTLTYIISDGTMVQGNMFVKGQISTIEGSSRSSTKVVQGIDIAELDSNHVRSGIRHEMQTKLVNYASSSLFAFLTMGISIAFFIFTIAKASYNKSAVSRQLFVFQLILFLIIGARILFYSMVEAASWHVELRYLASAQVLLLVFFIISLVSIVFASKRDLP